MGKQGEFEWHDAKADANLAKHGVGFDEAQTVFGDPRAKTIHDPDHSMTEDRFVTLGLSLRGRLLTVIHADNGDNIRIISARTATPSEARAYAQP